MKIDNSSLLEAGANCSCTQVSREANGLVTGVLLDLLPMTSVFSLNRFLGIQLNSQYPCGLLCFCLSLPCIGQDPEPHRLDTLPQMSHVTCHLSHVTCHMSNVTCHMSRATCHMSSLTCHNIYIYIFFVWTKWWS